MMEMPKMPVVSRYFVAYLASFVAVAPFFRTKVRQSGASWGPRLGVLGAEDPKTPQIDGGNGAGGSPEDDEDVAERPVASESSSDVAEDEGRK